MDTKKWPILAQVLIASGIFGSIAGVLKGLLGNDIVGLILGIAGIVIFWSFYKFKKWALTGINILLSLNILLNLITLFSTTGGMIYFVGICYSVLVLVYFNTIYKKFI